MHNPTHQKILTMLEGCSSAKPMEFDTLQSKTGLLPDTLAMVLAQMQHSLPATINSCIITKAGKSRTVYWPTGVVRAAIPFRIVQDRNIHSRIDAKVQPNTATSPETTMSATGKGGKPSELNQTLYNMIQAFPGIREDELVRRVLEDFPKETDKHIRKTLGNMRLIGKKVTGEGKGGDRKYQLDSRWIKAAPTESVAAAAATPVQHPATAAHDEEEDPADVLPAPVALKQRAEQHEDTFMVQLVDDRSLVISLDGHEMHLSPTQAARLQSFMACIKSDEKPSLLQRIGRVFA
jgi:hypothetical protein